MDPVLPAALSKQLDSVFEEDEEAGVVNPVAAERKPLAVDEHDEPDDPVGEIKHHKSILKRQVGMDRSTPSPSTERSKSASLGEREGPRLNLEEEEEGQGEGSMPMAEIRQRENSGEDRPDRDSRV